MPLPLIPAIAAASGLISGGLNALSTSAQNRRSMRFSREMYDRQRDDNISFWNMQNEYNSPQAQMKRLQEAGLNPALMYGKGASPGIAGNIKSPDVQSAQFKTPEYGTGIQMGMNNFLNSIYDLEMKAAQVDLLKAQKTATLEESALKRATGDRSRFDLAFESELRDVSLQARKESLRQLKTGSDVLLRRDEREAIQNDQSIRESIERILGMRLSRAKTKAETQNIRETLKSIRNSNAIQELDIELRKLGINPNHPMWAQILGRLLINPFMKFQGIN